MITQIKGKIIQIKKLTPCHYRLRLEAPSIARAARPGQFVHVRCAETNDPLLRRPLSFHRIGKNYFELLYHVVGKGTEILAAKKPGDFLNIIGPLGNGFNSNLKPQSEASPQGETSKRILIAGGMGVAPLLALAEKLTTLTSNLKPLILIGAKSKKDILCEKDFKKLGCDVQIATDDGSKGHKGLVTDLLKNLLKPQSEASPQGDNSNLRAKPPRKGTTIFACGPDPMLREVIKIAKRKKIKAQLSFENFMGCGIGACLGCAIMTKNGYKRVCKDGPVFEAKEF